MPSITPLPSLLAAAALISLSACASHTAQGVKQDATAVKEKAVEVKDAIVDTAVDVKDKAVQGGKEVGRSVGSGLERAGEAVKDATN